MIIVMKPGIPAEEELRVKSLMEGKGFRSMKAAVLILPCSV